MCEKYSITGFLKSLTVSSLFETNFGIRYFNFMFFAKIKIKLSNEKRKLKVNNSTYFVIIFKKGEN